MISSDIKPKGICAFVDVTSIERDVRLLSHIGARGPVSSIDKRKPEARGSAYQDDGTELSFTTPLTEEEAAHLQAIIESVRARITQLFR